MPEGKSGPKRPVLRITNQIVLLHPFRVSRFQLACRRTIRLMIVLGSIGDENGWVQITGATIVGGAVPVAVNGPPP
jgi:hypothetical protein